jgi:glycosyltransferase involved in cell wall biosynthesis
MTDLIVSPVTPRLTTGTGVRTFGVTAALARHGPVEVAFVVFDGTRPEPAYAELETVKTRPLHASRGLRRGSCYLRSVLGGVPEALARGVSPELVRQASAAPRDVRVIADGPVAAAALLPIARRRDLVYLAHNLESGFREMSRPGRLAQFERNILRSFSECWMATRSDARGARSLGGDGVNARYVPNVVDANRIVPVRPSGTGQVLFVGDFTYDPNREGLAFLTEEVMPLVWARRPDVRLAVAGRGLSDPPADERVTALGFVEELRSAYAASDVVAVPLLSGGGSPLKFVEALAYGLPVVATRHAAARLEDATAGEHFVATADGGEFARALERLLDDPPAGAAIGAAGRELVRDRYSIEALAGMLAR